MLKKIYKWIRNNLLSKAEENGEPSAGYFQGAVRKKAFAFIKKTKGSLLEIGCGEGFFLKQIVDANLELQCSGVELRQDQVDRAKGRLPQNVNIVCEDASKMSFSDSEFDLVVGINLFMNLPTDEIIDAVIKDCSRVTKKGGNLILDIRNQLNPIMYLKYKTVRFYDDTISEKELRTYKLADFKKRLNNAGFKIVKVQPIASFINFLAPAYLIECIKE